MTVPSSKTELLAAIDKNFTRLIADLAKVPPARIRESTLEGHAAGTMMSPSDLGSYLVGWNELVLKWLSRDDQGLPVDFPESGYVWNQLGQLAQKFYRDYGDLDWPDLLVRLNRAKSDLVATITARSEAELYGQPWYGKWTKGRMIQLNSASPYINARGRIRKWLRETA